MPSLRISRDRKDLGTFTVHGPEIVIGRSPSCTVTIANPSISRNHVKIVRDSGVYLVRDLGSLNGVYVNGNKITEAPLIDQDEITLGPYRLVFFEADLPEQQPRESKEDDTADDNSVAVHERQGVAEEDPQESEEPDETPFPPPTIQMPVQAIKSYKPQAAPEVQKGKASHVPIESLSVTQRVQKLIVDHPLFSEKEMTRALRRPEYAKTKLSRRKLREILEDLNLATPQKRLWYFVEDPAE
jgi:pSer/pThr/pTyr-binding forkhead associated (FHA) protein